MSRGFVKEDDQEEAPFIPPRAALPPGAINYVTPNGFLDLQQEKKELEEKLLNLESINDKEKRLETAVLSGKINLLNERISSARILNPAEQPQDEARFGATVTFKILSGKQKGAIRKFQLVGVDEADIKRNKIAFVAPIAKVLTGKKVGERVAFSMGSENQEFEILDIQY